VGEPTFSPGAAQRSNGLSAAETSNLLEGALRTDTAPSPCAIPNGWQFNGPCQQFSLTYPGPNIKLGVYRGLTFITHFGITTADGQPFVLGLGTSDKDITGKDNGVFPVYGHAKGGCATYYGGQVRCKGTGFAYMLLYVPPTNKWATGLQYSPTFRIKNTGKFPGTRCQQAMLGSYAGSEWVWLELPQIAKPQKGSVTFKPFQWILTLGEGYFQVEAFHCW
jgi:hypothetical protein